MCVTAIQLLFVWLLVCLPSDDTNTDTQTSTRTAHVLVSSDARHTSNQTNSKCVGVIGWQTHKRGEQQMGWCYLMADTQATK